MSFTDDKTSDGQKNRLLECHLCLECEFTLQRIAHETCLFSFFNDLLGFFLVRTSWEQETCSQSNRSEASDSIRSIDGALRIANHTRPSQLRHTGDGSKRQYQAIRYSCDH